MLGIIGSDNKTINLVDETGYYLAIKKSLNEMELYGSIVGMGSMGWSNKGTALSSLGMHEEAPQAFDKAIQLTPNIGRLDLLTKSRILIRCGTPIPTRSLHFN